MQRFYAIVSDIHGNMEALREVEKDASRLAQNHHAELHFVCLGDVVDYGPQPNQCMDWVRQHASLTVLGNHDREAIRALHSVPENIDETWWPITLWTRRVLAADHKAVISSWKPAKNPVPDLPRFTLFHSHLHYYDHYLQDENDVTTNLERMRSDFGLFGHTHLQGYFEEEIGQVTRYFTCTDNKRTRGKTDWKLITLDEWHSLPGPGMRALFNPGSVGRPRQHDLLKLSGVSADPKAAYMLICVNGSDNGHFMFRRVKYDWNKTIEQLRQISWSSDDDHRSGKSIDMDRGNGHQIDSDTQKLYDTLDHIDEELSDLVNNILVPRILAGE